MAYFRAMSYRRVTFVRSELKLYRNSQIRFLLFGKDLTRDWPKKGFSWPETDQSNRYISKNTVFLLVKCITLVSKVVIGILFQLFKNPFLEFFKLLILDKTRV